MKEKTIENFHDASSVSNEDNKTVTETSKTFVLSEPELSKRSCFATDKKDFLKISEEITVGCETSSKEDDEKRKYTTNFKLSFYWHSNLLQCMNSKPKKNEQYIPTNIEQLANVITHGTWVLPSIFGFWLILSLADTKEEVVAGSVYGLSIILLFTVSTAFHSIAYCQRNSGLRTFLHIGDRVVIYVFIASSYTPWLVLKEYNRHGSLTLWLVWTAALLGILYQYKYHEKCKWLETLLYIFIATLPSLIIFEMKEPSGVKELATGGLAYFLGVFFFKSDGNIPFAHAIWHVLVIVGASIHFYAVCVHLLTDGGASKNKQGFLD